MDMEPNRAIDPRLVRALSHPVRAEIMQMLIGEREVSSQRMAVKLEMKRDGVSYHLGVLRQCGAIELARTEQSRGVAEAFYRPAVSGIDAAGAQRRDDAQEITGA
jgi:DNA-binding transcriptional ArsR family regulator